MQGLYQAAKLTYEIVSTRGLAGGDQNPKGFMDLLGSAILAHERQLVTDEMVEAAVQEVRDAKHVKAWDRWTDHEAVRAMLTAALSAKTT